MSIHRATFTPFIREYLGVVEEVFRSHAADGRWSNNVRERGTLSGLKTVPIQACRCWLRATYKLGVSFSLIFRGKHCYAGYPFAIGATLWLGTYCGLNPGPRVPYLTPSSIHAAQPNSLTWDCSRAPWCSE